MCSLTAENPIKVIVPENATCQKGDPRPSQDEAGPSCLVVMYHYVRDDNDHRASAGANPGIHALTPSAFERQIDQLCARLEPVDWPTLYAWTCGRATIPSKSFLLTFDDGLADHAETVAPILQSRGLRGVFFIPGAVLTEHRMLSAHAVHLLLSTLGVDRLQEEIVRHLSDRGATDTFLSDAERKAAEAMYHYETRPVACLKYLLTIKLPEEVRKCTVDRLFEEHVGSSARWARHWYLGWDDLVRMESAGHTIGGHGFQHEAYRRWDATAIEKDVRRVAAVLREGLGPEKRPFSFPFGSVPPRADEILSKADFVHAFTTEQAWANRQTAQHQIPRFDTIAVDEAWSNDSTRDNAWPQACST